MRTSGFILKSKKSCDVCLAIVLCPFGAARFFCFTDDRLYSQNPSGGVQQGKEEDGSGSLAEHLIESASLVDALYFYPVEEVQGEEKQGQECLGEHQRHGDEAKGEVEPFGGTRADKDDQRALAHAAVGVAVAVVVHQQQAVGDEAQGEGGVES